MNTTRILILLAGLVLAGGVSAQAKPAPAPAGKPPGPNLEQGRERFVAGAIDRSLRRVAHGHYIHAVDELVRHFEGGFGLSFADPEPARAEGHENITSNLSD